MDHEMNALSLVDSLSFFSVQAYLRRGHTCLGERMARVFKERWEIRSIALIGNYLPGMCGIATFITELVEALSAAAPPSRRRTEK